MNFDKIMPGLVVSGPGVGGSEVQRLIFAPGEFEITDVLI